MSQGIFIHTYVYIYIFNIIAAAAAENVAILYTTYENILERLFVYKNYVLTTCIYTHAHLHSHLHTKTQMMFVIVLVTRAFLYAHIHILCIANGSLSLPRPLHTFSHNTLPFVHAQPSC